MSSTPILSPFGDELGEKAQTIEITNGNLLVLFRDNSESKPVLSGVKKLINIKEAKDFTAFDPDSKGSESGLNFEHIISGHSNPNNAFTPRLGRYDLFRLPDKNSAMLVRQKEDEPWQVVSSMKHTVTEPHYIDLEFKCKFYDKKLFGDRGYAIFFWADYMNDVAEAAINFLGIDSKDGQEQWIKTDASEQHKDWSQGGTYKNINAKDLEYDKNHNFCLNNWNYDYPRFTNPFYYGKMANNMVFMIMFDRTYTETDEIRFSLFKFKLPKLQRPAWDFQYVVHKVEENVIYEYKARVVWKKFVSPEDCLLEYKKWTEQFKK